MGRDFDEDDEDARGGAGLINLDMGALGSGSMSDPLRHAVGLRSAQDKFKMRLWDSFPPLFQNTIFHGEQDPQIRSIRHDGTLGERLALARELKEAGNVALKSSSSGGTKAAAAPSQQDEQQQQRQQELQDRILGLQEAIVSKERELKDLRQDLRQLQAEQQQQQGAAQLSPKQRAVPSAVPTDGDRPGGREGLEKAIASYEKAAGILRYVECVRPDWKNSDGSYKGIEDSFLRVDASALEGDGPEASEARELVTSCYLNIALAAQKLGDFEQMRKACTEVLEKVSKESVKALYRRAQARVAPTAALDSDRDAAIRDLVTAAQLSPQDKDVRGLLSSLRTEKKAKEASERSAFAGLFNRGEVVTGDPKTEGEAPPKLDLRDPKVQQMLDIYPGPDHFKD